MFFVEHQVEDDAVAGAVGAEDGEVVQRALHVLFHLKECIKLCKELKASHVVAVPLMLWNPELIDNLTEETIKAELSHENHVAQLVRATDS